MVYVHGSVGSTNDLAKKLALPGAPERALVVARRQTAGRGRGTNRWWSGAGVLTFSILIKLPPKIPDPALISLITGLSVIRGIRLTGIAAEPMGVKWPNDIYSGPRKLGGILVEGVSRRGEMNYAVVGIGLNVNTTLRSAPADLRATATSLRIMSGRMWNENRLMESILRQFFASAELFFKRGFAPFFKKWRTEDILEPGRCVTVIDGTRRIAGKYQGLQKNGAIEIIDDRGQSQSIISGTLEF